MRSLYTLFAIVGVARASCPYMDGGSSYAKRQTSDENGSDDFLAQFTIDDSDAYLTSDVGGPIADQNSLSAGERGPTLLEDFIFRQKITHFDHERVPERAVHARGAGAHGVFESYADWSNITAASFLGAAGKQTPLFLRFSTVAGSRGSADTARDVHGFALRFYTDEGNFDIVGNNIPVFFIQDAILFPDLIHAVKPSPEKEIPQAATAHDSAWDFFSQQPSALHTLFWAMAGYGIPRSYRHIDGFGVHTFRFVTDDGNTKLVKFHAKSLQGKASLVWEEAQVLSGKNGDFHRQDLWDAIEAGQYPEWEFGVQIIEEEQALSFGFDVFDPTKIIPEELVPVTPLGKFTLNRNTRNYFAETEQIMFQPGHMVRGIDFSEDPLLQGRLFSYLDTQINRHGGPNFEQLPINRPHVPIHNNNRDGAGQHYIPLNVNAYSPNTISNGYPRQANQTNGRGFFTAPNRSASGTLQRAVSSTFSDVWSQPRLFYNSLNPAEKQFLINAIRFETSHLTSDVVKQNVLIQLNRVSNEVATHVAEALGMTAPAPDPTYYHDNTTSFITIFNNSLPTISTLRVGVLTTTTANDSLSQAASLTSAFASSNVSTVVIAESLRPGISQTYSAADATGFDGLIVTEAAASALFSSNTTSSLFPTARPSQLLADAYRWGKPVAVLTSSPSQSSTSTSNASSLPFSAAVSRAFNVAGVQLGPGVYTTSDIPSMVSSFEEGLKTFRFTDRFVVDI